MKRSLPPQAILLPSPVMSVGAYGPDGRLPDIEKVRPMLFGSFGSMAHYGVGENPGKVFSSGRALGKSE